jgi:hypothetical protein
MMRIFRTLILFALAIVVIPSFPAMSAGFPCEGSIDCPMGQFCKTKAGQKVGHCVSSPATIASSICKSSKDCPMGQFCSVRPGHAGHCVGDFASTTIICENALDCPMGRVCKIRPGRKTGFCAAP